MEPRKTAKPYSPEVRARAVRMVTEHQGEHASQWAAICSIAAKIGCTRRDAARLGSAGGTRPGSRAGMTARDAGAAEGAGAGEPRAAPGQRDPAQGVGVFCDGGARPPVQAMIAFIDDHRGVHGVEPFCRVLPIAPSTYHVHAARCADPGKAPARARRDGATLPVAVAHRDASNSPMSRNLRTLWSTPLPTNGCPRLPARLHGDTAGAAGRGSHREPPLPQPSKPSALRARKPGHPPPANHPSPTPQSTAPNGGPSCTREKSGLAMLAGRAGAIAARHGPREQQRPHLAPPVGDAPTAPTLRVLSAIGVSPASTATSPSRACPSSGMRASRPAVEPARSPAPSAGAPPRRQEHGPVRRAVDGPALRAERAQRRGGRR